MAEVKIHGLEDLSKKLKKLPKNLRNRHVGKALRAGAKPIVAVAKGRVPVQSGLVKRNIKMRTSTGFRAGRNADVKVRIGVNIKRKKSDKGADPYYWRFLEFGTSKMKARSFLRVAFRAKRGEALRNIIAALKTGLKIEARR